MKALSFHPREECGVVGIWNVPEAAKLAYLGLYTLQHRGQESAGIVTAREGELWGHRGMGLVADVFDAETLNHLPGTRAIGHVRYSTTGDPDPENCQPLQIQYRRGGLALAHNGNIVNASSIRRELELSGAIFHTTVDSEVILHLLARDVGSFEDTLFSALSAVRGAYSMVILTPESLVAVRDPNGFRPLLLGRLKEGWVVASETCAFDLIGAVYEREVEPGEVIIFDREGLRSRRLAPASRQSLCIFELIYFSRPDSTIFEESVHEARLRLGAALARACPAEADVVISVPDSSNTAALGYAREAGLPFEQGLIRSHYIGRTFIEPDANIRDFGVRLKYNPVRAVLEGRRIVLVDDSIVRGSTSRKIVRMIRAAGAREIHMRISCPPWRYPCNYGIDTPEAEKLIAHRNDVETIRKEIDADSLGYLTVEQMLAAIPNHQFCTACFTGDYPVRFETREKKTVLGTGRRTTVARKAGGFLCL
ncbi:MAG: amidophosphoribosyltransferase [Candidatus Hydrogenedentota bacterium]|nr:MAG: amidophosphoribosyltransferase [Candidatus Hydrogenedentota bacterium]